MLGRGHIWSAVTCHRFIPWQNKGGDEPARFKVRDAHFAVSIQIAVFTEPGPAQRRLERHALLGNRVDPDVADRRAGGAGSAGAGGSDLRPVVACGGASYY